MIWINDLDNEMEVNPFIDPTESDIEEANVSFILLDEDSDEDDVVDVL